MVDEPLVKTVVQPRRWTTAPGGGLRAAFSLSISRTLTNQWRRQNREQQQQKLGRRHFPKVPLQQRNFESTELKVKNVFNAHNFIFLLNRSKPTKENSSV